MSTKSFVDEINRVMTERQGQYASPADNHGLTAQMFDLWTRAAKRARTPDHRELTDNVVFTAEDVCVFNVIQKLSRLANGTHDDSWLDIVGYAENVAQLRPDQRNTSSKNPVVKKRLHRPIPDDHDED